MDTKKLIEFLIQEDNKTLDIDTGLNIFISKLIKYNRTGTLKYYKRILKPLIKYINSLKLIYIHEVNQKVIDKYVELRQNKISNNTLNKEIKALLTCFRYLTDNNYINNIPFKYKPLKVEKTKISDISKNDILKIINYFNNNKVQNKYILAFYIMLSTGIRTNELVNIKTSNIDLKYNKIYLDYTKTHNNRYIYINDSIKYYLLKELNQNNFYLFNDNLGNKMTPNNIRCFIKKLKHKLNIEVLSPHKLRHYFATEIYKNSLDIYLTSKLLGHTDIKTTQIYLDLDLKEQQDKCNLYNPIKDLLTS